MLTSSTDRKEGNWHIFCSAKPKSRSQLNCKVRSYFILTLQVCIPFNEVGDCLPGYLFDTRLCGTFDLAGRGGSHYLWLHKHEPPIIESGLASNHQIFLFSVFVHGLNWISMGRFRQSEWRYVDAKRWSGAVVVMVNTSSAARAFRQCPGQAFRIYFSKLSTII